MTQSPPSLTTAKFIAKILATGKFPASQIGKAIQTIEVTLRELGVAPAVTPSLVTSTNRVKTSPAKRPQTFEKPEEPVRLLVSNAPAQFVPAPSVTVIPPRRRGRRPKLTLSFASQTELASLVEPSPLPAEVKLVRRTAMAAENEVPAFLQTTGKPHVERLRGVVKWFDARSNKGALRLVGFSGDVPVEPSLLASSGVKRLYKDQEIEAEIDQTSGKAVVTGLFLPSWAPTVFGNQSGSSTRTVNRQARPVVVEVKRDSPKQRRERVRAENTLTGKSSNLPEVV